MNVKLLKLLQEIKSQIEDHPLHTFDQEIAKQGGGDCAFVSYIGKLIREATELQAADEIIQKPAQQPLTDLHILGIAYCESTKYKHANDPSLHKYVFVKKTLIRYVRAIESMHGIKLIKL